MLSQILLANQMLACRHVIQISEVSYSKVRKC